MKLYDKVLYTIVIIFLLSFIFVRLFSSRSEKILLEKASMRLTNTVSYLINKSINKILYDNTCDNIIKDYVDSEGNIKNIDFDNYKINKILYLITDDLLNNKLFKFRNKVYYISLGLIHDTPVLNNIGPKIPFIIDTIESVNNESKINVKEYGINSSIVEIVINIDMKIEVIMPFKSKMVNINKSIILDSKIIQGKVPNYYGGLISSSLK